MSERTIVLAGATSSIGAHAAHVVVLSEAEVIFVGYGSARAFERDVESALARAAWTEYATASAKRARCARFVSAEDGEPDLARVRANEYWQLEEIGLDESASAYAAYVGRVRAALSAASRLGCERFVHLSTAYVASDKTLQHAEELVPDDGPSGSLYVDTMRAAEHEVAAFCRLQGLSSTILRPSTLIGSTRTLRSGHLSAHSRAAARCLRRVGSRRTDHDPTPSARDAGGHRGLNLLCVDWLRADIERIVANPTPGLRVHHLTGPSTVSLASETSEIPAGATCACDATFARSLPAHPGVPSGTEAAYVAALLKAADGTEPIDTLHYRALDRAGSPSLTSYWLGKGAATVVLVNALAMPVEVLEPMMQELRFGRTVLTWESRSLLDLREPFDAATVEANASVAELARLVTEAKKDAVDLVAWCNGALIALDFALRWPERVRKLVLLNAPLGSGGGPSTEYAGSLGTLLETAAKSRKRAAVLGSILAQAETDPTTVARREAPSAAVLRHHVRRPFRSAEDLFRYATAMRAQAASPTERLDIPQETLLVLSEHDAIVGNERALEWAKSRPNVRVEVLRDADHWALHGDARVARIVDEFLRAPAERATVAPLHCLHLNR